MPPNSLLPLRSSFPSTFDYLYLKYENYQKCIEAECWDDAFVNAHLIFIHWLYQKIWIITKCEPMKVRNLFSLHGFDSNYSLDKFLRAEQGIELSQLKLEERKLANIFRELFIDEADKKRMKSLIDKRNSILHPSGTILCSSLDSLNEILEEQYDLVTKISLSSAHLYINLSEKEFRRIEYSDIASWGTDPEIEAYVVRQYELAQIDIDAILLKLSGAI